MALEMQTNNKKKMPWIPTSMTQHGDGCHYGSVTIF